MSGDALTRFLEALQHASKNHYPQSGGHRAQCPAHDDRRPSLSVSNGDGKVLLHCHKGCDADKIVASLGLHMRDLYDTNQTGQSRATSRKPTRDRIDEYHDECWNALYRKVRKPDKIDTSGKSEKVIYFQHIEPTSGSWVKGVGENTRRVLFRLPDVLQAVHEGRTVYVVEGEPDCKRLASLGYVATCNDNGASISGHASKWRPAYTETLIGAHVIVIADNDEPGFAHARYIARELTGKAASVKLVRGAVRELKADFSNHADAGFTVDDLVTINDGDEPAIGPEKSFADDYEPIDWDELWNTTTTEPDWLCPGILERGRLHAIYAPRKHKKSLFTLIMIAEMVSGHSLLGRPNPHETPLRVLYIDIENARDDIRQRLQDAGYGPRDLANLIYLSFPSLPGLDSPLGGEHLKALVERHKPDLVVLDTTSRVVTGEENDADTFRALYRNALAPIKSKGVAVLRLDHAGKDLTLGQRGSSAKGDDLDTAWLITKQGDDRLTLRLDFQRTNHHPQEIQFVQHADPLRFVRLDAASDRPEVTALVDQLDRLGVPREAGRDTCRKALTNAGIRGANDALTQAVKIRKDLSGPVRTATDSSDNGSSRMGDSAGQGGCGPVRTVDHQNDHVEIDKAVREPVAQFRVSAAQSCPGRVTDSSDRSSWSGVGRAVRDPLVEQGQGSRTARPDGLRQQDQPHDQPQDPDEWPTIPTTDELDAAEVPTVACPDCGTLVYSLGVMGACTDCVWKPIAELDESSRMGYSPGSDMEEPP